MRYLILTYIYTPNGKIDEGMTVTNRVRTRDWQTASVILDFRDQQVLKASIKDTTIPKDWDRIVGYYYPFYTRIMERLFEENGHPVSIKSDAVEAKNPAG